MIENFSETRGGFVICHVCDKSFNATPERRYTVKEKDGFAPAIIGNTFYDAFDCPYCECQNVVGLRLSGIGAANSEPTPDELEEPEEPEEPTEAVTVTTETTIEVEEPTDYTNE